MAPKRQETCKVCGADRYERAGSAYCETHWREYKAAAKQRCAANGATSYLPDYQRIAMYRKEAIRQGADESESWWCAMAAEIRYQQHGHSGHWLQTFIARELDWLHANTGVLASLDARQWAAPTGDTTGAGIDDGYDIDEGAA